MSRKAEAGTSPRPGEGSPPPQVTAPEASAYARLGPVAARWDSPGRIRPTLLLVLIAAALAVAATAAAFVLALAVENAAGVLVVLWFIILIKIVPQILGRLTLAERTVAVHRNGIAIDGTVLPWSEIEEIFYYGHLHHLNKKRIAAYTWTFVVKDGREILLRASNDWLGSHIDFERLKELLENSGCAYRRFDDPRVIEQRRPGRTAPRAAAPEAADVAVHDTPWSDVLDRLEAGERRRKWRVATVTPRGIAFRLLGAVVRPVMHLSFVLCFLLGLEFVLQLAAAVLGGEIEPMFGVLERIGLDGIPRLLAILALAIGALQLGRFLYVRSDWLSVQATKYGAFRDQLVLPSSRAGIDLLREVVEAGTPYAVYLRSFGAEYFRYDERRADISSPMQTRALTRDFDSRLIARVSNRMTCFGLANLDDPCPPTRLIQLFTRNRDWQAVADTLVQGAERIILYLSAESPSLLREMAVLARLGRQDRTLIVLPGARAAEAGDRRTGGLLETFPNRLVEGQGDVEEVVDAFLGPEPGRARAT